MAIEVARRTVLGIAAAELRLAAEVVRRLDGGPPAGSTAPVSDGLRRTRDFLRHVRTSPAMSAEHGRHLGVLHALDHLDRLAEALDEPPPRGTVDGDGALDMRRSVVSLLTETERWLRDGGPAPDPPLEARSREMAEHRRSRRAETLALAASGDLDPDRALERLEGLRWLDRLVYHTWRSAYHLTVPDDERIDDGGEVHPDPEHPPESTPGKRWSR